MRSGAADQARIYLGRGKELAICTLSSIGLLNKISKSDIMDGVAIAGRLLSENRDIDAIIRFTLEHPDDLRRIIVCGKEVKGHRAGQALLTLARNGIDRDGKIIGALGPYPILKSPV
jgi:tetrahydromethanopterin S-methyltransferase subunit A